MEETVSSLVITRKDRQRVFIGDNVVVEILESRKGQVRLRITAPRSVMIRRDDMQVKQEPGNEG